jgi:hypothetical protein
VRFQVLTALSLNMTVFWDVAPCSLVEVDRHFRGAYGLHHQGDELGQVSALFGLLLISTYFFSRVAYLSP